MALLRSAREDGGRAPRRDDTIAAGRRSPEWYTSTAATTSLELVRLRRSTLRDPERPRHAVRARERRKGMTAFAVVSLVRGTLELGTTARSLLGDDCPDRRRRDRRAPARAPLRHRGLPRRGGRSRRARTPCRSPCTSSRRRRTSSPCSTASLQVRTERALRVLQRRLRRPGADRRARERRSVPRARVRECASRPVWATPPSCARTSCPGRSPSATWRWTALEDNVFHLPVRGTGDGGVYSTVADIRSSLDRVLPGRDRLGRVGARDNATAQRRGARERYGLGFWLDESSEVVLIEGLDAGVSFRSTHDLTRTSPDGHLEHDRGSMGVASWPIEARPTDRSHIGW